MKFLKIFLICLILSAIGFLFSGCASLGGNKSAMYNISAEELEKISQSENLTPEQKVIIKHASVNLKQAEKTESKSTSITEGS